MNRSSTSAVRSSCRFRAVTSASYAPRSSTFPRAATLQERPLEATNAKSRLPVRPLLRARPARPDPPPPQRRPRRAHRPSRPRHRARLPRPLPSRRPERPPPRRAAPRRLRPATMPARARLRGAPQRKRARARILRRRRPRRHPRRRRPHGLPRHRLPPAARPRVLRRTNPATGRSKWVVSAKRRTREGSPIGCRRSGIRRKSRRSGPAGA